MCLSVWTRMRYQHSIQQVVYARAFVSHSFMLCLCERLLAASCCYFRSRQSLEVYFILLLLNQKLFRFRFHWISSSHRTTWAAHVAWLRTIDLHIFNVDFNRFECLSVDGVAAQIASTKTDLAPLVVWHFRLRVDRNQTLKWMRIDSSLFGRRERSQMRNKLQRHCCLSISIVVAQTRARMPNAVVRMWATWTRILLKSKWAT